MKEKGKMGQDRTLSQKLFLKRGSERVLRWLERYPLQRAQDLILALAPWESHSIVYERLAELEQQHLIEVLHSGMAQGKRLYHLSPAGMYVCDHLRSQISPGDAAKRARWEQPGRAQVIREEREYLVRLLPRLPVFFVVQDLINGLVLHAPSALTNQGRRASLVQWSWLRDYSHGFTDAHEKRFRVRVEGVLTFCLRVTPVEQVLSTPDPAFRSLEEHWYTFLLMHCPLDAVQLMQSRLDRLLRWRESAERTAIYRQMPPLLLLATSERQAEWWHQAALQVASRLHVDRPFGALACLPNPPGDLDNGWRLAWHQLGTKEHCPIQEFLRPLAVPAVPELLAGRGTARENATPGATTPAKGRQVTLPLRLTRQMYALAEPATSDRDAPARTKRSRLWSSDYRLASVRLTPRHWEILHLLFAHPFLSREDLVPLLPLSRTSVSLLLAELKRAGYLREVATPVGERWQLAEAGLVLLAHLVQCHVHRLVHVPVAEKAPLEQRGVPGLLHQIHHTAGVYGFFTQLHEVLATRPHARVRWWETGVSSERHFRYAEKTYRFRPDAQAAVQIGERQVRFWLEWDRGTMSLRDLRVKFTTYAMYLLSREWARSTPSLPALVCVAPEMGQERRLAEAARQCLVQVPAAFRMYTTTTNLLMMQSILAPIWQQVVLRDQQMPHSSLDAGRRVAVFGAQEDVNEASYRN